MTETVRRYKNCNVLHSTRYYTGILWDNKNVDQPYWRQKVTDNNSIDRLLLVMVSSDTINELTQALVAKQLYFTRIESSGGFLRKESTSLVIGIANNRYQELLEIIRTVCQRKRIFVPARIETPIAQQHPLMIEAETGGAVFFAFKVERFEQF